MSHINNSHPEDAIVLVEDVETDAELTLRVFKKHRLANRVLWVKDGAEALELIFGTSDDPKSPLLLIPRVVLLDIKLPKVDGHQVLARLKSDPRTRTIPVVVLTSSHEESDLERSYNLGANSYVVKPLDVENFFDVVERLGLYWILINEVPAAFHIGQVPK